MIEDIWKRYFSPRGYQLVPNQVCMQHLSERDTQPLTWSSQTLISLKLYYGEECRVADVSRHISFAEILAVISKKFGRPLQPSYVVRRGTFCTVG
jgi:hypothetical protein